MALSEKDRDEFIQKTVLVNFNTLKTQPLCSSLFNTAGVIIASTDLTKQQFGLEILMNFNHDTMFKLPAEDLCKASGIDLKYISDIKNMLNLFLKLLDITIQEKTRLNFIMLIPRKIKFKVRQIHLLPVFHPNGEVVAVQTFSSEYRMFHHQEYCKYQLPDYQFQALSINDELFKLPVKLTNRQHEILFFLVIGFSQSLIAKRLQVARGTIAKTLNETICPKFGINDSNTNLLIKKATSMGYDKYLPPSLCVPCIIGLDPQIIDKYFAGNSRFYPA